MKKYFIALGLGILLTGSTAYASYTLNGVALGKGGNFLEATSTIFASSNGGLNVTPGINSDDYSTGLTVTLPLADTMKAFDVLGAYTDGIVMEGIMTTTNNSIFNFFAFNDSSKFVPTVNGQSDWSYGAASRIVGSKNVLHHWGFTSAPWTSANNGLDYTGHATTIAAYDAEAVWAGTGTTTDMVLFDGYENGVTAQRVANLYGLRIGDLTHGTSTNYAIKTGLGLVSLGDTVTLTTLAGSGTRCVQTSSTGALSASSSGCGSGTVTSVATNNGLTGGTITTTGTIGLNTSGLTTIDLLAWNGSNLTSSTSPNITGPLRLGSGYDGTTFSGLFMGNSTAIGSPTTLGQAPVGTDHFYLNVDDTKSIRAVTTQAILNGAASAAGNTYQGINAVAAVSVNGSGALTASTNGGGLRNRYVAENGGSGVVTQTSAISAFTGLTGTGGTGAITNAADFHAESPTISAGTISNFSGLWIRGGTPAGTITTRYGIQIDDLTGGTTRYGISQAGATDLNYFNGKTGIGTSTPYAQLSVQSNASTGDAFVVATTTAATIGGVDNDGHTFTSGPAGAISSCGTGSGSVVGDDQSGDITTATAATACTLTFSKAYQKSPVCTVTDNSLVGFADISSVSTTAVTFGISSALTGGHLYYQCVYHR